MKTVKTSVGGREIYLLYNAEAFFSIQDTFDDVNIFDVLSKQGREGYLALVKIIQILAECGELARRYYGYGKGEILGEEEIRQLIGFLDIADLKHDVQNAIILGIEQEIDTPEKEIDLVLQELEKKTTNP